MTRETYLRFQFLWKTGVPLQFKYHSDWHDLSRSDSRLSCKYSPAEMETYPQYRVKP